jgi:hypothetical protein
MDDSIIELERLAANAVAYTTEPPSAEQIRRFMTLFEYTAGEAWHIIKALRANPFVDSVAYDHWDLIRKTAEARGYDREAYLHELRLEEYLDEQAVILPTGASITSDTAPMFMIRAVGLVKADRIKEVCGMERTPMVETAYSTEGGMVSFLYVNGIEKEKIRDWLRQRRAELYRSEDDASTDSKDMYNDEDDDATMPQHRPDKV